MDCSGSGLGKMVGFFECGNDPYGSLNGVNFLTS
jgi:hypothetical protein